VSYDATVVGGRGAERTTVDDERGREARLAALFLSTLCQIIRLKGFAADDDIIQEIGEAGVATCAGVEQVDAVVAVQRVGAGTAVDLVIAVLGKTLSLPAPARTWSLPSSAMITWSPSPPEIWSLPSSAKMQSLPSAPSM
jgi:hypothetical protein